MTLTKAQLWDRYQKYYTEFPSIHLAMDISRMNFPDDFFDAMKTRMQLAFIAMAELEKGGIANPDERRMVGHYWLRNPSLAPTQTIGNEIRETVKDIQNFAQDVHSGRIRGAAGFFDKILVIGIGGSALGPQFVSAALGNPKTDKMTPYFLDNTDPDGFDRVFMELEGKLDQTLCLVISKSGGTKETRNGMLETQAAYERAGLRFNEHAVAVTGQLSELDKVASSGGWIKRFPMWDWVGGRTSELSAVGLLPAALQGVNITQMLDGAKACDDLTRQPTIRGNPAALLALMWHWSGNGKGSKNMVILPYKDRLELFSKYCQQLIMESLGKERDVTGRIVNQGLAVFGNKGATDQHSYIQQLREGLNNFFATFIEVLRDRDGNSMEVDSKITSGDYLSGFFQGTRTALYENERESVTLTISEVSPFTVGVLIALYERTVGLYASLINVNAYHQPGVEAGKRAATSIIQLQTKVMGHLEENRGTPLTSSEIAGGIGTTEFEIVFKICEHLAANLDRGIVKTPGGSPFEATYQIF